MTYRSRHGSVELIVIAVIALLAITGGLFVAVTKNSGEEVKKEEAIKELENKKETENGKGNEPLAHLQAEYKVVFVDKMTGKSEPVKQFPIVGSFGPSCGLYDLGPGESPDSTTTAICEWRKELQKNAAFEDSTNAYGLAQVKARLPVFPQGINDPLAKTRYAGEVAPSLSNIYKTAQGAGWNNQKFEIRTSVDHDSRYEWRVIVELIGFRGDAPASFRQ